MSEASPKIAVATNSTWTPKTARPSNFVSSTTTSNGTSTIRITVKAFGRFMAELSEADRILPPMYDRWLT